MKKRQLSKPDLLSNLEQFSANSHRNILSPTPKKPVYGFQSPVVETKVTNKLIYGFGGENYHPTSLSSKAVAPLNSNYYSVSNLMTEVMSDQGNDSIQNNGFNNPEQVGVFDRFTKDAAQNYKLNNLSPLRGTQRLNRLKEKLAQPGLSNYVMDYVNQDVSKFSQPCPYHFPIDGRS